MEDRTPGDGGGAVRLCTSTSNLRRDGHPLPGLPLFLCGDRRLAAVANCWVVWMASSRQHRATTVRSYAWALKRFLDFHRSSYPGVGWEAATEADMVSFKLELAVPRRRSDGRARRADADTVAQYAYALDSFFAFAAEKGFIEARPFRVQSGRARTVAAGGPPGVTVPKSTAKRPVVLTPDEFRAVRAKTPLRDGPARVAFDLALRWEWATGLRGFEVCGLRRSKFVEAVRAAGRPSRAAPPRASVREAFAASTKDVFVIDLVPEFTKGGRGGEITVPRGLAEATVEYLEACGRTSASGFDPDESLLLNTRGKPLKAATVERYYRAAASAAGVPTGLHALRHTYATRTLAGFSARGKEQVGLLFLKNQLRHRQLKTTERYLHVVHMESHGDAVHMVANGHHGAGGDP